MRFLRSQSGKAVLTGARGDSHPFRENDKLVRFSEISELLNITSVILFPDWFFVSCAHK
jgi:hypothetical protein